MTDFSLWDILRNLLMALRWTVVLSLIAFIGGGLVGALLLFLRLRGGSAMGRAVGLWVGEVLAHRLQAARTRLLDLYAPYGSGSII